MSPIWTLAERGRALSRAEREGVDLVVIGGGITGAGVLRDAASRGLRCLLVERSDFAAGTSSRSSKMLHGGLRYIAEGQLGITYQSCRERDQLLALNPNLARRVPFLFPTYEGESLAPWQMRTALFLYRLLAGFRGSASYRILSRQEVFEFSRDLRREGLQAAGLYYDAQVDDARLVIESLKSARALGAEAVNHAPLVEIVHGAHGKIAAVGVQDRLARRRRVIRTHTVVNAAGPSVERVRGLDRPIERPEMRPAKGVHIVIPGDRIHAQATVTFEAGDGRHAFLSPWDDVAMIGTTDTFTREIDEPLATQADVDYLLSAANRAFPRAGLTRRDILGVFAGVRPLVVDEDTERPPSAVSREHRISEDDSGLVSVCGGKLTLYRSMGEAVVDRVLRRLPCERRSAAGPSRTWELPLREDSFDCGELEAELCRRFGIASQHAEHLVRTWGADAERVLREAAPEWRRPIGSSRYLYAEIPWSFRTECPATLCDLLERRLRLALFARGQGLPELKTIARIASRAAGWDAERTRAEATTYAATVRRRYQLAVADAPEPAQSAA